MITIQEIRYFIYTKISSFPNLVFTNSASDAILLRSTTSSWWKTTRSSEIPESFSFWTASRPIFSSMAVNTTKIPLEANCLHISYPIPFSAPVTTACLRQRHFKEVRIFLTKEEEEEKKKHNIHLFAWMALDSWAMADDMKMAMRWF